MEKQNYYLHFQKQLEAIKNDPKFAQKKPRLLLHACCGPCSSTILEQLDSVFEINIYYYNPNIYPQKEYTRRLTELLSFVKKAHTKLISQTPPVIEAAYKPQEYYEAIQIKLFPERKDEPEKQGRCFACYEFRMQKAAEYASENNYDFFCTTLSISPHKDSQIINQYGKEIEQKLQNPNIRYLYNDFKKKEGFKRSVLISDEYNLYRQDYCGCIYSLKQNILSKRAKHELSKN